MTPIAIFYHCLFQIGDTLLPASIDIVCEQMSALKSSGLLDAASEVVIGVNGGDEATAFSELFPAKSTIVYHGLQCRNELRTIILMEEWVKTHPDWYVLYHHSKGATHVQGSDYASLAARWRRCMTQGCVWRWQECVALLDQGYEAVGVHWITGQGWDRSQHYFAGTFFFAASNFLRTLPPVSKRKRIAMSGIDSAESRYESEVWIGNGPRLPRVKDMDTSHGIMGCP